MLRRKQAILAVALVALGGGAIAAYSVLKKHRRDDARQAAGKAFATFERCLIGPPLAEGETVERRLHQLDLGNRPADDADDAWPQRCIPQAKRLLTALREADGEGRLTEAARVVLDNLRRSSAIRADLGVSGSLWRAMRGSALPAAAPDPVVMPPPPALIPAPAELGKLIRQRVWGQTLLSYGDRRLCTADTSGVARCIPVPESVEIDTERPLDSDDGGLPQVVRDTQGNLDRLSDGAQLITQRGLEDGFARGERVTALVQDDSGHRTLIRLVGGKTITSELQLEPPPEPSGPRARFLGGYLIWSADHPVHTFAARVVDAEPGLGRTVDLGAIQTDWTADRACRSTDALVVVLAGLEQSSVWFVRGDDWQHAGTGSFVGSAGSLTCSPGHAALTWGSSYQVHQRSCTPEGCTDQTADLPGPREDTVATALGDQVLMVWNGVTPHDLGTWMRVAPLAELPRAHWTLLRAGVDPPVAPVVYGGGRALVVLDPEHAAAITIDASGDYRAVARP